MYYFISYTSSALMHGRSWASTFTDSIQNEWVHYEWVHCDIKPSQWGAELLAPGYGLRAKAESTNCFTIYSKCVRVSKYAYLHRYNVPVFIFLFLSM